MNLEEIKWKIKKERFSFTRILWSGPIIYGLESSKDQSTNELLASKGVQLPNIQKRSQERKFKENHLGEQAWNESENSIERNKRKFIWMPFDLKALLLRSKKMQQK